MALANAGFEQKRARGENIGSIIGIFASFFAPPQNPAPTPPTDCQRFVALVAGIASSHNSAEGFMDEMARTFTAANNSSIAEMQRTQNFGLPQGRQNFGPANGPNAGCRQQFRDSSNQVRHFVAGLVAGYRGGHGPALIYMNDREEPNTMGQNDADIALNGVSTNLGANHIAPLPPPRFNPFGLPVNRGFHNVADAIRREICLE